MSFQGNLRSVSFPDVLQLLTLSKKSGTLLLRRSQIEKKVYLKNGAIIYAESNILEDNFDNLLLASGIISLDELQKARKVQELTGKDLPSTLVYLNLADKDKIANLSRRYVENIVFSLFSWEEGDFVFEEGQLPNTEVIVSSLNTMNILMEGTRRIDEWTRIRNALPPDTAILQVASDVLSQMKEIKLSPVETLVLALVDGERCISEMREKSSLDQLTFAKSLYNLVSAGIVRQIGIKERISKPVEDQKSSIEIVLAMYNLALDIIIEGISKKMGKTGVRIIANAYITLRPKYKVLEFMTLKESGGFDFSNFAEMTTKLDVENRIHEISTGLSNLVRELLVSVTGTIGVKQKVMLAEQISQAVKPIIRENESLLRKYGLLDDFIRALD